MAFSQAFKGPYYGGPKYSLIVQAGNRIIEAIEEFRNQNNRLPATLSQLPPNYIKTIPEAPYGSWYYEPTPDSSSYKLYVQQWWCDCPMYQYESTTDRWGISPSTKRCATDLHQPAEMTKAPLNCLY